MWKVLSAVFAADIREKYKEKEQSKGMQIMFFKKKR